MTAFKVYMVNGQSFEVRANEFVRVGDKFHFHTDSSTTQTLSFVLASAVACIHEPISPYGLNPKDLLSFSIYVLCLEAPVVVKAHRYKRKGGWIEFFAEPELRKYQDPTAERRIALAPRVQIWSLNATPVIAD